MSILINSYADTGVLVHAAALLSFSDDEKVAYNASLALDGLRISFQVLDETSHRLDDCLTKITNRSPNKNDGPAYYIMIDTILGYVWTIIDHSKRVLRFIKVLDFNFNDIEINDIRETINLLTKARDSFQHLDERINQYYAINHGSINGDLSWGYREIDSTTFTSCFLASGSSLRPAQMDTDGARTGSTKPFIIEEKQEEEIGIFDLTLHFIKSENLHKGPFTYATVSIDKIAKIVNDIIMVLLHTYNEHVKNRIGDKNIFSLPYLMILKIDKPKE